MSKPPMQESFYIPLEDDTPPSSGMLDGELQRLSPTSTLTKVVEYTR